MWGDALEGWTRALRWVWCLLAFAWLFGVPASGQTVPKLREASAIAYDSLGNLYIADAAGQQVLEATMGGSLLVVAGSGAQGYAGDGGPATAAQLNQPQGLAFGSDGTLYIADTGNQRVRAVSSAGVITTFAGTGVAGFGGDGGPAVLAALRDPGAIAVDSVGGLLICDRGNHRLRRVLGGSVTTVAGTGVQGGAGDGGLATSAQLDMPSGVSAAPDGRIFVADRHQQRVRVIEADGTMQAFAGMGVAGFSGDGGPAIAARFSGPEGLVWTPGGMLLVADAGNQRVRQINAAGVISTVAGSGVEGVSIDGAVVGGAAVRAPRSVAVSSYGLPVTADTLNGTVRELVGGTALYLPAALASGRMSKVTVEGARTQVYGTGALSAGVSGPVGTPQGKLSLLEGTVPVGEASLGAGAAGLDVSGLEVGSHELTVQYLGDGLNPAGSSGSIAIGVTQLGVTATASSATVPYGAPLPVLSGTIAGILPRDVGEVTAVFGVNAGNVLPVGAYPVTVSLTGQKAGNYAVSLSPSSGSLQVVKAPTGAFLGKVTTAYAGMPLNLSATIASGTSGVPTGTVEFLDGSTVVATGTLSGGLASAAYATPAGGTHILTVEYLGDANFLPSTSQQAVATVSAMPDFVLASAGPQSASTSAGDAASFTLSVSAVPGPFTGAVALSATGLPPGATVSFSPPMVVPGSASAPVTVTVQTAGVTAARMEGTGGSSTGVRFAVLCGAGVLCGMARRRKRWIGVPGLLCVVLWLSGCGARTVGEGDGGVVAQTYTVQITGTATNLAGATVTHNATVMLTIQE